MACQEMLPTVSNKGPNAAPHCPGNQPSWNTLSICLAPDGKDIDHIRDPVSGGRNINADEKLAVSYYTTAPTRGGHMHLLRHTFRSAESSQLPESERLPCRNPLSSQLTSDRARNETLPLVEVLLPEYLSLVLVLSLCGRHPYKGHTRSIVDC